MRAYIVLVLLLLIGCSSDPIPLINISDPEPPVAHVERTKERTIDMHVLRDTPKKEGPPVYRLKDGTFSFTNRQGQSFSAPDHRLHVGEAHSAIDFRIRKGHYFLLNKATRSFLMAYDSIDTTGKVITFNVTTDPVEQLRVPYTLLTDNEFRGLLHGMNAGTLSTIGQSELMHMQYEELKEVNPGMSWEDYVASKTLGHGVLYYKNMSFPFAVAHAAGNPIVLDMNGNGKYVGDVMDVYAVDFNVYKPEFGVR